MDNSLSETVLDVATGTGHAALHAGIKVGAEHGLVVGVDIAEAMVHLANSYAKTLSRCNARFELMDGEHTMFVDNEFDAVLCSYGIFSCQTWPPGSRVATGYEAWWLGVFFGFWGDSISTAVRFV
jgi:ubiquinone/menaquinone biosynthesis C-methylase UbiE